MKASGRHLWVAAAVLFLLYFIRVEADLLSGIFGIIWSDEGIYLLPAKNTVLFHSAHFFEGDKWRPELIAPLLHYYGLLAFTAENPVLWVRAGMAAQVMAGAALLGYTSYKHSSSRVAGVLCFLCIACNPVLFFYARVGLAEGQQFLVLAMAIAALFELHRSEKPASSFLLSGLCGLLTAVLFLAKISAGPMCAGLAFGFLLALCQNDRLSCKKTAATFYLAAVATCFMIYFGLLIGGHEQEWWRANIEIEAKSRLPGPGTAAHAFWFKMRDIAAFLILMPICIFYYCGLLVAMRQKKGFVFILGAITLVVIALESLLGGEIRRNFFSLCMLSIVAGFSGIAYINDGFTHRWRIQGFLPFIAVLLIVMHITGIGWFTYAMLEKSNFYNVCFGVFFLMLSALAYWCMRPERIRWRKILLSFLMACGLIPMLLQCFVMGNSRAEITGKIEALIKPEAYVTGSLAANTMLGLKRKMIVTNCTGHTNATIHFATDREDIPLETNYYLTPYMQEQEECAPDDFKQFKPLGFFTLFNPANRGILVNKSGDWVYVNGFTLYEK